MGLFDIGSIFGFKKNKTSYSETNNYNFQQRSIKEEKALSKYVHDLAVQADNRLLSTSAQATINTNKQLMQYQYALERQSRQNSYVDTKTDLLNAGYNPLLAVGQQSNYTPVSSGVQAESAQNENLHNAATKAGIMSDIANGFATAANTWSATQRNRTLNDVDRFNARSTGALNNSEIALNDVKAAQITSATRGQDIQNTIQKLTGLKRARAELREIGSRTKLNYKQIDKLESDIVTSAYQNMYLKAMSDTQQSANELMQSNSAMSSRQNDWQKKHPFLYGLNQFTGTNAGLGLIGKFVK